MLQGTSGDLFIKNNQNIIGKKPKTKDQDKGQGWDTDKNLLQ